MTLQFEKTNRQKKNKNNNYDTNKYNDDKKIRLMPITNRLQH